MPHPFLRRPPARLSAVTATTIRRQLRWVKKEAEPRASEGVVVVEEEDSEFVRLRKKNWARLIAKVWLEDPSLCPSCSKEMKVISALTSPHQDDVIERMLKSRGQWDPPWKRERRARGPPLHLEVLDLPALIQAIELRQKTCVIEFPGSGSEISFACGQIVAVTHRGLEGREAFFKLMAENPGSFRLAARPPKRARNIHESTTGLLLECARQMDEQVAC